MRESILSSCDEFNHGHFFMLVQVGILVYYPSIAVSIIYQDAMQQEIDDNYEQEMQQQQSQSQIIRFVQQIISQIMQKQQPFEQFITEQKQQKNATKRAIKMVPKKEKKGGDDVRFIVRLQGGQTQEGGQENLVWTTVYIQI